jgi:hypothetical protein
MNQLLVILITAMVTGVVSISGLWIGSYLTRENDAEKWRRDHALEAYSQFIEAVEAARFESDRIYISTEYKCGTEDHKKQAEVILDKQTKMNRLAQRVFLLAPDVVNERAWDLIAHMGKEIMVKSMTCPKIGESEREPALKKDSELLGYFRAEARNDLRIHPSHRDREKPWWKFWR